MSAATAIVILQTRTRSKAHSHRTSQHIDNSQHLAGCTYTFENVGNLELKRVKIQRNLKSLKMLFSLHYLIKIQLSIV